MAFAAGVELDVEAAAGCEAELAELLLASVEGVEAVAALELSTMLEIELELDSLSLELEVSELEVLLVELDFEELATAL